MLNKLIGNETDYRIEHRLLNVVLLFGMITSFWSTAINYILGVGNPPVIACAVSALLLGLIYYLSLVKKLYQFCMIFLILITLFAIIPIVWVYNGGTLGSVPIYVVLFSSIGAILFNGFRRVLIILALMVITNVLLITEYQNPLIIRQYPNDLVRYMDVSVGMMTTMIANACLFMIVLSFYKNEHKKAVSYLAELEKQKLGLEYKNYLTAANERLQQEIDERKQAELLLRDKNQQLKYEIAERFRAEKEAREQKRQLETILLNSPDIIARYDLEGRQTYISEAARTISLEPHEEKEVIDHFYLNDWNKYFCLVLTEKQAVEFDMECYIANHKKVFFVRLVPEFDDDKVMKSILGFFSDITSLKRVEKEMARLDRLDIIGQMAASIGHEVRNPMTTVRGFLQLFGRKGGFSDYRDEFSLMISELDRANEIITEFLSLAKNKAICLNQTCLNHLIHAVYPLLKANALEQGHEIDLDLGDIQQVLIDEKEIRQLIFNLARNGFEAIKSRGKLIIKTYQDGSIVKLAVQDNGTGIPPEVQKQLGTPFVTTKEKGTGLGLPVCYRIVERHNAKLEFETGATGTTFTILFHPQ